MELYLVLIISALALGFAFFLIQNVIKRDTGSAEMQAISNAIKEGAEAAGLDQLLELHKPDEKRIH